MKLTLRARKALPSSDFVFPKTREFPIEDVDHAEAAERLVGRDPSKKAKVDAAVHERYPNLGKKKKKSKKAVQHQAGSKSLASIL